VALELIGNPLAQLTAVAEVVVQQAQVTPLLLEALVVEVKAPTTFHLLTLMELQTLVEVAVA
tara:strand:+ start:395 stop:580 length:186 start_codon:yes stop_codon:yes gene_type:complete